MVRIKKNNFVYNKNIYQCIVPGCQNIDNDKNDPSIFYYIISENGLNQNLLINFLENIPIRPKVSRICSDHYTNDCFHLHKGVKMLKTNAVPTIRSKQNPTLVNGTSNSDKAIQNKNMDKNISTNDDNILMRPPQTTVVKKSQLQSIQRDSSILSSLLRSNKEFFQPQQNQNHESNRNSLKQPQSENLQTERQEEQLQQKHSKKELLRNRLQNGNLQNPQHLQHNETLDQQSVLSPPQQQEKSNRELHKPDQLKPLSSRQKRKNNANLKKQQQSTISAQQSQSNEELKWVEHQKSLSERKQKLKQRKELIRIQQYNRNFSESQKPALSKHKQQQQQIEKLHHKPEQMWPQQQHQRNRYLQELLLTPPNQEPHYHQLLRDRLQNRLNNTLEECIQSPQHEHHYQQLQCGDFQNQKQQEYNQELHYNQEFHYQYDHLQQQQSHQSNKISLEHTQMSYEQQQQRDFEQMESEKEQQHQQLSQFKLQDNGNISPQRRLVNEQQQSKSQNPSPIPHEEEHLIMCGYITFESCNNNFSYSCNFCSKNLENLNAFSAHLIRLHTNEIENEINSKTSNKGDAIAGKDYLKEISIEKLKCGIISISSKLYNLLLNCDFKFNCNFCDKKFEAINKFSEHIGKKHLDLLEKDKENDMEFEEDVEIDPSCILSFDQIDEINEFDISLNSSTSTSIPNSNNNSNNKIVMSVPMTDNSEIFMTIDINENNTNNINHNINNNLNNNLNKEIIEEKDYPMELDSLEKPKLKVHIKHSSWATRYFS